MPKSCHRRHAPSQNHPVSPATCHSRHALIQSSAPKCQSRVTHDTYPPLNSPPKCQGRVAADTHPLGSPIQQYATCRIRVADVSRSPITSQPRVAVVSCVTRSIQCFGAIRAARLDAGMRWGSELIARDCGHSSRRCYSSSLARCQDAKGVYSSVANCQGKRSLGVGAVDGPTLPARCREGRIEASNESLEPQPHPIRPVLGAA